MDGRQNGTDFNPLYPPPNSRISQQLPRFSFSENTQYLPRAHPQQSTALASLTNPSLAHHLSMPRLNLANSERQSSNASSSVSPTIQQGTQFQRTPYLSNALARQMHNEHRPQIGMQTPQEHERKSQQYMLHPGMQETRPPNVSNAQSESRSPSGSFSTDVSPNFFNNIVGPLLKQQDEKIDTKLTVLSNQLSQVNERLQKASNASLDETRTGNETILKALTHIAQKQQVLIDDMQAVKSFVGLDEHTKRPAYGEGDSGSLYHKLSEITHLVGDWIEKAGDPEANAERRLVDQIREYQQSVAFRNPSPVRHEMGTSPIPSRYLSDEDATMARDRSVCAATTPRVVHHEMAVSPIRFGEQKPDPPLQTSQLSTVHQAVAVSPFSTSRQAQNPKLRVSPMPVDGESQPDGDQHQAANDTLGDGVFKTRNHLPEADINPFQRAAARVKQTPSRRPTFQPLLFKSSELSDGHIRRPGFSPANWRGDENETDEFSSVFNPTSASSPKGGPIQALEGVDESLGGPSFARAPRLQKDRSLSSELTSVPVSRSPQRSPRFYEDNPISITSTKSSTSEASSVLSLGYPPQIDAPVEKQDVPILPVTSPRSDDEEAVANMVLEPPSSSQIDPADQDDRQTEIIDATDGEDDRSSSVDHTETPKRPRALSENTSPMFTQSSRNATPMVASSCSPPAVDLEPREAGGNADPPASPMVEDLPRSSESPVATEKVTTMPPAETLSKPPVPQIPQEVIEIGSSSVSPPPVATRRQPKKAIPSPSVSVIEISSDEDDDDVLPQIPTKNLAASIVQVKAEKVDDISIVPHEAEKPVDQPAVSITLQGATPEPELQPEPKVVTPAPKSKSINLLDDLLKRQLSPITPLPGDDKVKPKKAFDPKKYADGLQDDEDDIVPVKRVAKRPVRSSPRISRGGSQDSAALLKEKDLSKKKKENQSIFAEKGRAAPTLKLSKRKGENLAATRIKKRKVAKKVAESDEEVDVAPLKKASMRPRSDTVTASGKASKMGLKQEETSSPTRRPRGRPKKKRPEWPEPLPLVRGSAQPMIKCDGCPFWFHYSCVAVQPDDIRLRVDEIFYCPACAMGVVQNRKNTQLDLADTTQQFCGRPECAIETNYFLAKFIGRRRIPKDSTLVPQYLVKWEGWRLLHATWENPQDLGIDNPEEYVEALAAELRAQGSDLNKDENEYNVILLQEAKDAGWGPNGGHHKRWRAPHYDSGDDLQYDLA